MPADRITFELTEDQTRRYRDWVDHMLSLDEDNPCSEITVCFTLTSIGRHVVAYLGMEHPRTRNHLVLEDLLDGV
ncbi:MAG: hypothetical protein P1P84_08770 [Deferrisomatales bacterium]|nr:hypothetical protein [Deferrisomatales bacterium]